MDVLDSKVLVLNKGFNPIRMTTVRDAFTKVFSEAAEIITVEDGAYANYDFSSWAEVSEYHELFEEEIKGKDLDWVATPSMKLIVPRVIRMLTYERMPAYQMKLTRKNIYERDNYTCQYCGKKFNPEDLNLDHVTPRAKGGKNTWTNLVCSCIKCNRKKKDDTLKESGMKLLKRPVKPKPSFSFRVAQGTKIYEDWSHFVSVAYWNTELVE